MVAATDALRYTTTYTYDVMGRKASQTLPDPDGQSGTLPSPTTLYFYDWFGNLQYVVGPGGTAGKEAKFTTEYRYDKLNRKTAMIGPDPDGDEPLGRPFTQYAYDADGNNTGVIDPLGNVTTYEYDALGRLTKTSQGRIIDDGDPEYQLIGDSRWTHTSMTNGGYGVDYDRFEGISPNNVCDAVTITFDNLDFNADQDFQFYAYKPTTDANPIFYFDIYGVYANSQSMHEVNLYASIGTDTAALGEGWHKLTIKHGDGSLYVLPECKISKIVVTISGGNQYPTLIADALCLVQQTSETTYDAAGNVVAVEDARGNVANYEYDHMGRKIKETQPDPDGDGANTLTRPITQYAYDARGNLALVIDPLGHVTIYEHDARGRLTTTSQGRIIDDGDAAPDLRNLTRV